MKLLIILIMIGLFISVMGISKIYLTKSPEEGVISLDFKINKSDPLISVDCDWIKEDWNNKNLSKDIKQLCEKVLG